MIKYPQDMEAPVAIHTLSDLKRKVFLCTAQSKNKMIRSKMTQLRPVHISAF